MKTPKNKNKNRGSGILEVLIAIAVLTLGISAATMISFASQSTEVDTQTAQEALALAKTNLENARADSREDFNLVNPDSDLEEIYTKEIIVDTSAGLFTKTVTSKVSWQTSPLRNQYIELTTIFTNPEALAGGDTCSSVLEGDWTNPQKTEYEFGRDILNDTSSGFPITSIQTFSGKMYVTVNNTNGNNPGTFFILDISNPSIKPSLLSPASFDNSPVGEGLNAVAVNGSDYAYVASAYTSAPEDCTENNNCAQLQVINISDPANPSIVKNLKIPSITVSSKLAAGKSIFYNSGIVYLGLTKAGPSYDEFFIIDVGGGTAGGNPTNPIIQDSYKINSGVNGIFVRDGYAYLVTPEDEELKIFDVSEPSNISQVGGFDAPNGGGNNGNGKSVYIVGNKLYLGRTLLSGDELYVLNNTNPESSLPILGSENILNSGSNTSVNGIIVRDFLAFLITNKEFQILNIEDPTNITQYANPLTLPPGTGGGLQGTATDCEGNYIFVGSQSSNDKGYISVITSS